MTTEPLTDERLAEIERHLSDTDRGLSDLSRIYLVQAVDEVRRLRGRVAYWQEA